MYIYIYIYICVYVYVYVCTHVPPPGSASRWLATSSLYRPSLVPSRLHTGLALYARMPHRLCAIGDELGDHGVVMDRDGYVNSLTKNTNEDKHTKIYLACSRSFPWIDIHTSSPQSAPTPATLFRWPACARINRPFLPPAHLHCPHCCNTIALRPRPVGVWISIACRHATSLPPAV